MHYSHFSKIILLYLDFFLLDNNHTFIFTIWTYYGNYTYFECHNHLYLFSFDYHISFHLLHYYQGCLFDHDEWGSFFCRKSSIAEIQHPLIASCLLAYHQTPCKLSWQFIPPTDLIKTEIGWECALGGKRNDIKIKPIQINILW